MATITGRFGAVQRLLPKKTQIEISDTENIDIYGWDGFEYKRVNGIDQVTAWEIPTIMAGSTLC